MRIALDTYDTALVINTDERAQDDLLNTDTSPKMGTHIASNVDLRSLLDSHHQDAWGWACACCRGDSDLAHDVLHDSYMKVLDGRAKFAGRSSFKTWLFGVIRMTSRSSRRKQMFLGLIMEPVARIEDVAAPEAAMPTLSTSPMLQKVLQNLPERQREVALLVFRNDMTLEDAAKVMGISIGSCRTHYNRAKQKLKTAIEERQSHG